jgi:DNA-binding response OmpR family regulator
MRVTIDLCHGPTPKERSKILAEDVGDAAMRVILVEDNLHVQRLEADILSDSGHAVATAASAAEALQLLDAETAALITDIRLPGSVDGIALAQTARQRRPDLAIMLIGADVEGLAPQDLGRIADEALSKPFRVDEFKQRVATLVRIVEALPAARGTSSDKLHAAVAGEERDRACIRAWRMRAEELRTSADSFVEPAAREWLRRAAANYKRMADRGEALLTDKPMAPGEKAG